MTARGLQAVKDIEVRVHNADVLSEADVVTRKRVGARHLQAACEFVRTVDHRSCPLSHNCEPATGMRTITGR